AGWPGCGCAPPPRTTQTPAPRRRAPAQPWRSHSRSGSTRYRTSSRKHVPNGKATSSRAAGLATLCRMLERALEEARGGRARAEAELFELLSIPSVSAEPDHRDDCRRAATWMEERFRRMGL